MRSYSIQGPAASILTQRLVKQVDNLKQSPGMDVTRKKLCEYQAKTMHHSFLLSMSRFLFRPIISPTHDKEGLQSDPLDKLGILLDGCHCLRKKHKAFAAELSHKATRRENAQFDQS